MVCGRDSDGRPILPGTALTGALMQTAARVFPNLFDPKATGFWRRITGKQQGEPPEKTLQSLWRFRPSHRASDAAELRQGVGIRQATGVAAAEAKALYDIETLPAARRGTSFSTWIGCAAAQARGRRPARPGRMGRRPVLARRRHSARSGLDDPRSLRGAPYRGLAGRRGRLAGQLPTARRCLG